MQLVRTSLPYTVNPHSTQDPPRALPQQQGPLHGIRIVDLSTTFMGPVATMQLARMGADVIEAPEGDPPRYIGKARSPGMGPIFINGNLGKRSIVLDLKSPAAHEALMRILETADVFVHNMRPKAAARLGVDAATVMARLPRLIHCTMRGYGDGPYEDEPAYDDVVQGVTGIAAVQGGTGAPAYVTTPMVDKTMGLAGAMAILAAIVRRTSTGCGEVVVVPMFEFMASWLLLEQQGGWVFDPPLGPTGYARTASPDRKPYRTSDGYIAILLYTDRQWQKFYTITERPDLAADIRFSDIGGRVVHSNFLLAFVAEEIAKRTTSQWLELFKRESIPAMPVNTVESLFDDRHMRAIDFFEEVAHPTEGKLKLTRQPLQFSAGMGPVRPAPRLGEHTRDILIEAGYTPQQIDELGLAAPTAPGPSK